MICIASAVDPLVVLAPVELRDRRLRAELAVAQVLGEDAVPEEAHGLDLRVTPREAVADDRVVGRGRASRASATTGRTPRRKQHRDWSPPPRRARGRAGVFATAHPPFTSPTTLLERGARIGEEHLAELALAG